MEPTSARLLEPNLLEGLDERPIEELRELRTACQEVEIGLSYQRRLVQGPLDIVRSELIRRTEGGASDLASLLEALPEVLSDGPRSPALARPPTRLEPTQLDPEFGQVIDDVLGDGRLTRVHELDEAELTAVAERLAELEQQISRRRRAFHERIDALQSEITRRYASGEASVDSLLPDG
ncbi:MAG: aerial mycelium formation protein [Acidimicrobiia bacterium]|nr:aerial mycelium formation protein [Acidimicrobiia bacterium]